MEEFQFAEQEAQILLVKFDLEYLEANLKLTGNRVRLNREKGKETHIMAYARAAIKDNYANYGAVDSVVIEEGEQKKMSQSTIDHYLEKPYQEWFKKSIEIFILEEAQAFVKDFAQWLNSREEQFIYAPIQELLLSNGLNHPQVKMFFQAWLNETQDLKTKYSRDHFMKEQSYKVEQVKGDLRLTCKGRLVKL